MIDPPWRPQAAMTQCHGQGHDMKVSQTLRGAVDVGQASLFPCNLINISKILLI